MKKRERKMIRYSFIPLMMSMSLLIGMSVYYLTIQSGKLDEEGVALSLNITAKDKIEETCSFYLETATKKRIDLFKMQPVKTKKFNELLFFKGTASLKVEINGENLILVKEIQGKKKTSLEVESIFYEKNDIIEVKSNYFSNGKVDFAKFKKEDTSKNKETQKDK